MLGFFGVIFVVNGIFVYKATTTWTGVSTENAYEKGVRYNDTLVAAEAQNRLGWQSRINFVKADNRLVINFTTRNNVPISGLKIEGKAVRPTHQGYDLNLTFSESPNGSYYAIAKLPLKGHWRIEVLATSQNGKSFRVNHTLMVSP